MILNSNSTLCNLNEDEKIVLMELVENSNSTLCNLNTMKA